MPSKTPSPKFTMIGRGKVVHVIHTKAFDLKTSECQAVRKATVADKFDYKAKGLSPEAAMSLTACLDCYTEQRAKQMIKDNESPEDRKQRSNDARNEVLDRASNKKGKPPAKKVAKSKEASKAGESGGGLTGGKSKDTPAAGPKKMSKTKAGIRSTASRADGDPSQAKAQLLADHGKASGWTARIEQDDLGWVVIAVRGDETIWAPFVDGKFDENRYGLLTVGTWTGKLRAAHACRRQMSCEGRDKPFPNPGVGRAGPRSSKAEVEVEHESPEDAARRVPFSIDDDEVVIIDAVKGKVVRWRNSMTKSVEEGWVPAKSKRTCLRPHPKQPDVPGARILSFYNVDSIGEHGEVYGPERNVRLDKILRVI